MDVPQKHYELILECLDLMSRVFWGPDPQFVETLWEGGFTDFFYHLDSMLDGKIVTFAADIQSLTSQFQDSDSLLGELNSVYVQLFVNSKEGVVAPLFQSCYQSDTSGLMGSAAIDMKNRFESKGLSLANCHNEPPDHLSIELEYLYYLLQKGWQENESELINEADSFTREVLIPWTGEFSKRIKDAHKPILFSSMTSILEELLNFLITVKR